jgi:hypothetical protein
MKLILIVVFGFLFSNSCLAQTGKYREVIENCLNKVGGLAKWNKVKNVNIKSKVFVEENDELTDYEFNGIYSIEPKLQYGIRDKNEVFFTPNKCFFKPNGADKWKESAHMKIKDYFPPPSIIDYYWMLSFIMKDTSFNISMTNDLYYYNLSYVQTQMGIDIDIEIHISKETFLIEKVTRKSVSPESHTEVFLTKYKKIGDFLTPTEIQIVEILNQKKSTYTDRVLSTNVNIDKDILELLEE